jgi:hypothetical protein
VTLPRAILPFVERDIRDFLVGYLMDKLACVQASDFIRTKSPSTEGKNEETVFLFVSYLVE